MLKGIEQARGEKLCCGVGGRGAGRTSPWGLLKLLVKNYGKKSTKQNETNKWNRLK